VPTARRLVTSLMMSRDCSDPLSTHYRTTLC